MRDGRELGPIDGPEEIGRRCQGGLVGFRRGRPCREELAARRGLERVPGGIMGKVKGTRRKGSVLDRLKAEEAQDVLYRLLAAHPDLRAEAEKIARSLLGEVTCEAITDEVEEAVRALDLEDLNRRAGRHEWGYVEPAEAAWEILEEAVEPFVDDLKRQIDLGLETEVLELCKGLVLGLYRVAHGKGAALVEWAPDFPAEAAARAIETWGTGGQSRKASERGARRPRPPFPQAFINRCVPDWRDMVSRILSRKRKP